MSRVPYVSQRQLWAPTGLALGDINGDGLEDLYLCQDPGIPNLLFLAKEDGTYEEAGKTWKADWLEETRAALFIDLDNDGDLDLVASILRHVIMASNQDGHFEIKCVSRVSEDAGAIAAADYDRDGRVDLYVCGYRKDELLTSSEEQAAFATAGDGFLYHDANNGGANFLLRNEIEKGGRWEFRNTTNEVGLDVNNSRWSLAASWEDFDNDGDQDLYVANDFGKNCFYRNDRLPDGGSRFSEISELAGVEDSASGMAVAWGDPDLDGNPDLYVSNMWSAAGSRVMSQARFMPEATDEMRDILRRFAVGNSLFKNKGEGSFVEQSQQSGTAMGRWAWSSIFSDINNDGWEDLLVANGFITNSDDTGDL